MAEVISGSFSIVGVGLVTLILTVNGPETIWLLADRRLSFPDRPPKDDARKVMFLETTDATAILGYAGLGATALGTEPADWMSAVLRGRDLPLEQSLAVLAEALKQQFPRHMLRIAGAGPIGHNVFVPAFFGNEVRLYEIYLVFAPDRQRRAIRYLRHVRDNRDRATRRTPRFGLAGSGGQYLARDKSWQRGLLRMIKAHDRGQVPPHAVADHFARLNHEVHRGVSDGSVGPRCVVAWRYKKGGVQKWSPSHQFYTGSTREHGSVDLPIIGCGMDVRALLDFLKPRVMKDFRTLRSGEPVSEWNYDEINAELARLPDKPDENLR
jgi:hypothetical protein